MRKAFVVRLFQDQKVAVRVKVRPYETERAARMHAAGKNPRKRVKVSGKSKRAGSSAYRPGSSVCYDGSLLALLLDN